MVKKVDESKDGGSKGRKNLKIEKRRWNEGIVDE